MWNKTWFKVLVGLIVAALLVYFFFMRGSVKIKTAEASIGEIAPSISVSGEIKGHEIKLGTEAPLGILWIGVKEGDRVTKGQVLLRFENNESAQNDYERIKALYESGFATKQQLEAAKLSFNNSHIVSPINGVISLVANKEGEEATPGLAVISVVDPKSAYAELQIDESDIGDVTPNKEVTLSCDAYPELEMIGKLKNINEAAEIKKTAGYVKPDEEDKVFRARVIYDDPEGKLKIGMSINAEIIKEKKAGVLIIPREAIFEKDGKQMVFLIKNRKAKETAVEIGLKDFVNVEITKGLKVKDKVAVTEIDKLKNGTRVSEIK